MNLGKVGRLGNALFELASTIGIADAVGEPPYFPWDWIHRPYFSLEPALFGDDIRNLPAHMLESDMKTVRPEFRGAGAVMPPVNPREATEFATHIDIRARGYLQDIRLFWPSIGKIRNWLKPSPLAQATLASYPLPPGPKLAVHVRRGDNVFDPGIPNKADYHSCPSEVYYRKGIELMTQTVKNYSLVVISDDIPWCKEVFPEARFFGHGEAYWKEHEPQFGVDTPHDWLDLFLLAQCDAFVISGSTFGIWGAILADVPYENVVRPDRVYGPLVNHVDESLLFHPSWRVLKSE